MIKHFKTDMHNKAVNLENKPGSVTDIYQTTPIWRAFASDAQRSQVRKLFNIANMICEQELAFTKFESIAKLEGKHGVDVGTAYHNRIACAQFVTIMGEHIESELVKSVRNGSYFSVMIDGATDVTATEKELVYLMFLRADEKPEVRFLR